MRKFYNIVVVLVVLTVMLPSQFVTGVLAAGFDVTASTNMADCDTMSSHDNLKMDCEKDCLSKCLMQATSSLYLLPEITIKFYYPAKIFLTYSDIDFSSIIPDMVKHPPIITS